MVAKLSMPDTASSADIGADALQARARGQERGAPRPHPADLSSAGVAASPGSRFRPVCRFGRVAASAAAPLARSISGRGGRRTHHVGVQIVRLGAQVARNLKEAVPARERGHGLAKPLGLVRPHPQDG